MMHLTAVVALFTDLGEPELTAWIERGWVRPVVRTGDGAMGDAVVGDAAARDTSLGDTSAGDTTGGDTSAGDAFSGPVFHDIDVARVRLIHDLRTAMSIEDETITVILSLLDQVYDLRAGLRAVLRAVDAQPERIREAILSAID